MLLQLECGGDWVLGQLQTWSEACDAAQPLLQHCESACLSFFPFPKYKKLLDKVINLKLFYYQVDHYADGVGSLSHYHYGLWKLSQVNTFLDAIAFVGLHVSVCESMF